MKEQLFARGNGLSHSLGLAVLMFSLTSFGQGQSKPVPTTKAAPKEAPTVPGYLSKAPPPGLRFAPPPKPPVASLPPLPITYDPQPVFTPDFAQPLADFPATVRETKQIQAPQTPVVPVLDLASQISTNRGEKIPPAITSAEAVSPQMLIRFFQNAKPAEIEMLMPNPVYFRPPVEERRSSSATYELK